MLEFERNPKTIKDLPLTPLIDVVFILIIFFMLTTTFMKMESLELLLPSSSTTRKVTDISMAHIYLKDNNEIRYGQRPVDKDELRLTLNSIFHNYPEQRVVVLVSDQVSLQSLVNVMDIVYVAGGKNVFVREWKQAESAS